MRVGRPLLHGIALGVLAAAATAAPASGTGGERSHAGEIVFVSARATEEPGEIYALGASGSRRAVFHSPGAEIGLATSPTGPALAFWSDRSGSWRLMLSPDGATLRAVAIAGAGPLDRPPWPPVFSPDGTRLLIPYLTKDAIAPVPALALAAVRGGAAVDLARLCGLPPTFAADGRAFACATPDQARLQVMSTSGKVVATAPGKLALWSGSRLAVPSGARTTVLSESGRVVARLAGVARAWSPDGRRLALTRPAGLVLTQPGRSAPALVVTRGGATATWAAFTPDGRELVYADAAGRALITAATCGGAARPFAAPPGGVWSRDGRYAVAVTSPRAVHVVVRDRLGHVRPASRPLSHDDGSESIVAWSGDGRRLLYDTSASGWPELWSMHADGSAPRRLTGTYRPLAEPAWNVAGTRLAYASTGGVVIARADGARLALLPGATPGEPSRDGSPSWSPDGRRIAVADATAGGASVLTVEGGQRSGLAVDGAVPAWSPDGRTIAFVDLDDGTVWGSAPSGADRHRLLPAAIHGVRGLAWSPDGARLAFSTDNGIYVAWPDARDPGRTVVRAVLPSRPSFSPDGSEIAYSGESSGPRPYRAVFVVGSEGGGVRQLTRGPYDSGDPAWRPATR